MSTVRRFRGLRRPREWHPEQLPGGRRSARNRSTGRRRPRNGAGSARCRRTSRPVWPPRSRSSPPCATSRADAPPSTSACRTSVASSPASTPSSETGIRSRSPEDHNEDMTVFLCSKCGTAITPEPAPVPDVSDDERGRGGETRRAPSTVSRGRYVIDPEPWGPPCVLQDARRTLCRLSCAAPWSGDAGFVVSAGSRQRVPVAGTTRPTERVHPTSSARHHRHAGDPIRRHHPVADRPEHPAARLPPRRRAPAPAGCQLA